MDELVEIWIEAHQPQPWGWQITSDGKAQAIRAGQPLGHPVSVFDGDQLALLQHPAAAPPPHRRRTEVLYTLNGKVRQRLLLRPRRELPAQMR